MSKECKHHPGCVHWPTSGPVGGWPPRPSQPDPETDPDVDRSVGNDRATNPGRRR